MPIAARLYIGGIALAGCLFLGAAAAQWWPGPPSSLFFGAVIVLGVLVSSRKIVLPGLGSTVSGGFAIVLLAVSVFDWQPTVLLAGLSALSQSMFATKRRPTLAQAGFNVANLIVCAGLAHRTSAASELTDPGARLALAGLVLFITNTLSVSIVVCLIEGPALSSVWSWCRFWSAPYYLAGGVMLSALTGHSPSPNLVALAVLGIGLTLLSSYYRILVPLVARLVGAQPGADSLR